MGDAAGIGPEVLVKCLAHVPLPPGIRAVAVGELDILVEIATQLKLDIHFADEASALPGEIPVRSLGLLKPGSFEVGALSAAGFFAYIGPLVKPAFS